MKNLVLHTTFEEIDRTQWQTLVDQSSVATFFQTEACFRFFDSLSFLTPFVFGMSENERLTGVVCGYIVADGNCLSRYFSRRAIVHGGPLLADDISEEAAFLLFSAVKNGLKKQAIFIEIRNYHDFSAHRAVVEKSQFSYQPHYDIHTQTTDEKQVWNAIQEAKRRQIQKTFASGVTCSLTTDYADISAFYAILKNTYKTRVKRPLFPLEFFEKLVLSPFGKLLVAKKNGRVVGGMACVAWNEKTLYEWFVCGCDGEKNYVSAAVTWSALQFAAQNALPKFDFMGAGRPNVPYGVRDFKQKFGGETLEFSRFLYICKPFLYQIGKLGVKILKIL